MAQIPLDKAYLTAIWLETLLYGASIHPGLSVVYAFNLSPATIRHQRYALLHLRLLSSQEKERDSMDNAGRRHLSVDGFHCARVSGLYRAHTLHPHLRRASSFHSII